MGAEEDTTATVWMALKPSNTDTRLLTALYSLISKDLIHLTADNLIQPYSDLPTHTEQTAQTLQQTGTNTMCFTCF